MRLFIAVEVPAEVRDELTRWGRAVVSARPGLRPTTPGKLHLTLAFLGETDPASLGRIRDALDTLTDAGPVPLALGAPFWLPRNRPRVLSVLIEDDLRALRDLHGHLASVLRQRAGVAPEGRMFIPHITVARARQGHKLRAAVPEAPASLEFVGSRVTLFQSADAAYGELHSVVL